jgi:hypothetical protein
MGDERAIMDTKLIDRIYESCLVPEFWPEVLDELGRLADAPGASVRSA